MKRWLWIIILTAVVAGGIFYGFSQQPVAVEAATAKAGPMQVTVEEEGKTRLRSRYIVSAPAAGYMRRLEWKAGDRIRSGQTITVLNPVSSPLLDTRSVDQGEARVRAAEANMMVVESRVTQTKEQLRTAQSDLDYWRLQEEREQPLVESGDLPAQRMDQIHNEIRRGEAAVATAEANLNTAQQEIASAKAEVDAARAALTPVNPAGPNGEAEAIPVRAPAGGRVIRVIQESEGVVSPGTPLMEIGDANAIEVEVELLSPDAVQVKPGTKVLLTGWGGGEMLEAQVRVVEPGGFTKVSALGVEEQRVRVIADIVSPEQEWERLGDGYRVEASFVLWEGQDILQIPANALFREKGDWTVFVIQDGVAHLRKVEVGHRTGLIAEILSGLEAGEVVVAHPDETVEDGFAVKIS